MSDTFQKRIDYDGDMHALAMRIAADYGFGKLKAIEPITIGFEDYNLKIETESGKYLVKIYAKTRRLTEIIRNIGILEAVKANAVNHPPLFYDKQNQLLHVDSETDLQMVTMKFIEGDTFYKLGKIPDIDQLEQIAREAVKINTTQHSPEYIFDPWAIVNMRWMFEKTKKDLSPEGLQLVGKAFESFDSIPFDKLPTCLVHGDLIKTNVILGHDGNIYVIDFSVANIYPRIQELAVMAANLLFDEKDKQVLPLRERISMVIRTYLNSGGTLTNLEQSLLFDYCLPGAAMEYMGSVNERVIGGDSEEIRHWENLGLQGLQEALS